MATLWTGGKIYTMAQVGETVEAVLVKEGEIVATGSVDSLSPHATSIQHLQGNVMYPGFVDSHLHIIGYGEKLKHMMYRTLEVRTSYWQLFMSGC